MTDYLNNHSLPDAKALEYGRAAIVTDGNYPSDAGIMIKGFRKKYLDVRGTWDSAAAKWQYSNDGTVWYDAMTALSADGSVVENDAQPVYARLNVASAGASTALSALMRFQVG